jgi:isoquinoline 1-oxidoreductase alpha subunit
MTRKLSLAIWRGMPRHGRIPPLHWAAWLWRRRAAIKQRRLDMAMISIRVNGTPHQLDVESEMPLLWALRDEVGLTGTKFGCGIAACGACTVHVNGKAVRSCSVSVGSVDGTEITTIEGLSPDSKHPVQQAWLAEDVPQCGYCQSGQIMATAAFLKGNSNPTDDDIDANLTNICRCGTYERLRRAVHRAAALMRT